MNETHRKYNLTDGEEVFETDWFSDTEADRRNQDADTHTAGSVWWELAPDGISKNPGDALTFYEYRKIGEHPEANKGEAYIAGGLRGGWEWCGWFYTIVGRSIICEPTMRLRGLKFHN